MRNSTLLRSGIYSVPDAAKYLQIPAHRIRRWVQGYPAGLGPLIENELDAIENETAISFINLMEARFIDYFVSRGVRPQSVRTMAEVAKDYLHRDHPFAMAALFKTDGRTIFIEATEKSGDKKLLNLGKNNWAMHQIIGESLTAGVEFDASGLAKIWYPRKVDAPHVLIHPSRSFGKPILKDSGIPTRTLYEALQADGGNVETIAHWYAVPAEQVHEAAKFELSLLQTAA